jgi:hypothetical protein
VLLVVETLRVEVPADALPITTEDGVNEQVGVGVDPVMLLHDSVTVPVYPRAGVIVIVELAVPPRSTDAGVNAEAVRV